MCFARLRIIVHDQDRARPARRAHGQDRVEQSLCIRRFDDETGHPDVCFGARTVQNEWRLTQTRIMPQPAHQTPILRSRIRHVPGEDDRFCGAEGAFQIFTLMQREDIQILFSADFEDFVCRFIP